MDLDTALQNLHADDAAATVVLGAVTDMARRIAANRGVDVDVMLGFAEDVLVDLLETPVPVQRARGYLLTCLLNRLRDWRRRKATHVRSLTRDDGRSSGEGSVPWSPRSAYDVDPDARLRGRFVVTDPAEERELHARLQHLVDRVLALAREHLSRVDALTIEGLVEIYFERTTPDEEAARQEITKNALQQRQTRARARFLDLVDDLMGRANDPSEREELRQVARLVENLRERGK